MSLSFVRNVYVTVNNHLSVSLFQLSDGCMPFYFPSQMYEHILSELGPWCLAEQDFCVRFFNLTANDERDSVQVCCVFTL
jgi:hypothetical protein